MNNIPKREEFPEFENHENFRFEKSENDSMLIIRHCDRHANHKQFLFEFSKLDFVREVNLPSI